MGAQGERDTATGAVVRLWNRGQEVVGGGFLVGPELLATCAHVVADALGADAYAADPPRSAVPVDFPLLTGPDPVQVPAVVHRWAPIGPDGTGDIAVLRLLDPPPAGARMPPLRRVDRLWGHRFRVLGFPDGAWDGVWTTGDIRGGQGTGWFQLQGSPGEHGIEGGFSGTPVWDEESGAVVGMTVAADRGATTTAYLVPIDRVLGLDPELLPSPYQGLAPFGEEHAELFFGRDRDIERLADAVARLPVVAVAGPSGAGKSSLLRAGLLPRLRRGGASIVDFRPVPGTPVVPALEAAVAQLPPDAARAPVLLADQFEELAAAEPAAARALLERIVQLAAADPPIRAVLTLRWAALDELLTPELAGVLEAGTVLVTPLDRNRLREAIVGPAERAPGLAFEAGLVDRILDDAGSEPGQLPLVESLLADLWDRREGGFLTMRGYEAAGGVAGAVAQHAERVAASIAPAGDERVRRLFTRLARPDRDGRFVRRPVPVADLPADLRELVAPLVSGRLLVLGPDGSVELAHQALIEHWPRLRDWLVEDREFLDWRAQLDAQRERWDATGRDDGALLRGVALAAAGRWLPARAVDVPAGDLDYVRRSTARQRREVRRWRLVTAVLAVLVLAASALSVVAVYRGDQLAGRLAAANAETLGRAALDRAPSDAPLAAQLALAAWRTDPQGPQARAALAKTALALRSVDAVLPNLVDEPIPDVLAAGDTLVLGRPPGLLAVTGLTGPAPQHRELPDTSLDRSAALSPDGRLLADVGADGSVRIRDLHGSAEPRVLHGPIGGEAPELLSLQFAPDGGRLSWLAPTGSGAAALQVLDLATEALVPHRLGPLPAGRVAVWLTEDPQRVLVRYGDAAAPDTRLVVASLVDGGEPVPLPPGSAVVRRGAAVVRCVPGDTAADDSASRVVVTPVGGSAPPLEIRRSDSTCSRLEISGDRGALVERVIGALERDEDILHITDLTTGGAFQTSVPRPVERGTLSGDFVVAPTTAVAVRPGAPPAVLLAHGTSVLRAPTRPAPAASRLVRHLTADGRYVLGTSGDGFVVEDASTGARLAALPGDLRRRTEWSLQDDGTLSVLRSLDGSAWELTRHELPTLRALVSFTLPRQGPAEHPASAAGGGGSPLITLSDGLLAAWDPTGRRPLREPVVLGDTPEERAWHRRRGVLLWSRPGHPDQALVQQPTGDLAIWDAVAGTRVTTITTTVERSSQVAFDPSGDRMAVLTSEQLIEIWDVRTATRVRPPMPAPEARGLIGFDADGFLAVHAGMRGGEHISLLDLERGRESGSLLPSATPNPITGADAVDLTSYGLVAAPYSVPITARGWHDRICAVMDRPFTATEVALLPDGVATDPPCGR